MLGNAHAARTHEALVWIATLLRASAPIKVRHQTFSKARAAYVYIRNGREVRGMAYLERHTIRNAATRKSGINRRVERGRT